MNKALTILLLVGLLAGGVIGGILLGQYLDAASNTSEADQGTTAVGTGGESGVEGEGGSSLSGTAEGTGTAGTTVSGRVNTDIAYITFRAYAQLASMLMNLHSILLPQTIELSIGSVTVYVDSPIVEVSLAIATVLIGYYVGRRMGGVK